MSDEKTVTISKEEYKSLLEDRRFLEALRLLVLITGKVTNMLLKMKMN